ncbi:MAG TPA: anthranilate phosphoribosyltransferase [Holophagaceae bacterium]|nr:anthranilate phosphoribosyltransferase [Holophagaceae bacterium]
MTLLRTHNPIQPLPAEVARELMERFIDQDTDPLLVGACLALLAQRTPTAGELTAFADALSAVARPFAGTGEAALDTCGTGGDGASTANLSTLAALFLASRGVAVAKHGNRAATSTCGSADLLESLGHPLERTEEDLRTDLRERRFAFLFAPAYHPLLGRLKEIRTRLGIPTIFNLLGPLLNPARPAYQVLGVAREELLEPMAGALAARGVRRAFVLHGRDAEGRGLDEASLEGPTRVVPVVEGRVLPSEVLVPRELGIPMPDRGALVVRDRAEAVAVAKGLLAGQGDSAFRPAVADAVALQAALGLLLVEGRDLPALAPAYRSLRAELARGFSAPLVPSLAEVRP